MGEEYQKLGTCEGSVGIVKYITNVGRGRCNKRQITKEPERMMTKFLFNRVMTKFLFNRVHFHAFSSMSSLSWVSVTKKTNLLNQP
jgi:hypothetical protein